MRRTEVIRSFSKETLNIILKMERASFPTDWQYEDMEEYYGNMLSDQGNINIFLLEDDLPIGYLLACPHDRIVSEIKNEDPLLENCHDRFYVETIEVLPAFRDKKGALMLIYAMIDEAKKKTGFNKFSMHVRTTNGLSSLVMRFFGHCVTKKRNIQSWCYGGGEPYVYMEVTYFKK